MSNAEFADLSGFTSEALESDLEELRDYNNTQPPPAPPSIESLLSEPYELAQDPLGETGDDLFD